MKNMKNKKFLLSIFVLALFGIMTMANVYAVDYYDFGSDTKKAGRLEAEAHITATQPDGASAAVDTVGTYKGYEFDSVDSVLLKSGGTLTFSINAKTAGTYIMKFGYFTNNSDACMSVTVGAGETQSITGLVPNGLNQNKNGTQRRLVHFKNVEVELTAGENTIVLADVKDATEVSVAIDFVEFYQKDSLYYYPIECQQLGMQTVGERIEAEWGYPSDPDAYLIMGNGRTNASGLVVAYGNNASISTAVNYKVVAEKAGEYDLQVSSQGANLTGQMTCAINGTAQTLNFTYDKTSTTTVQHFSVTLKAGENTISFIRVGTSATGKIEFDWFKLIEKNANIDTVIQAEDYSIGAMKLSDTVGTEEAKEIYLGYTYTTVSKYLDGFYTEFNTSVDCAVEVPVTVSEAGWYDVYLRAYTGSNMTKINISLDEGTADKYPVHYTKTLETGTEHAHNVYRFYLDNGTHTLTFTYNNKACGMDWLYITRAAIQQESTTLKVEKDATYSVGLNTSDNFTISDTSVATYANGTITAVKRGSTEAYHQIQMNDKTNYLYSRPYTIEVPKLEFTDTDQLTVELDSLTYNGKVRKRDMKRAADRTAPEGWKVECSFGNGNYRDVGIYHVTVRFTHDDYQTVRKTFTCSILRKEYAGNDLIAQDTEFVYNGERQQLVAKAPKGWTIEYVNNGRTNAGSHEVTVYFTHQNYETVEKTATLTIVE